MAWCSGARCRIGDRRAREGAWLACTRRVETGHLRHTVDRMLRLLSAVDVPVVPDLTLYVPPASANGWQERRPTLGLGKDYLAVASTTRWPSKAWPDEAWVAWAKEMADTCPGGFALLGSASEREEVTQLADRLRSSVSVPVVVMAGETSVGDLMAIIERARLTVSNDSAALHLATGLGGRCVGLFGPTRVEEVGPYGLADQTVSAPAGADVNYRDARLGDRLMRQVSVEAVVRCCRMVLDRTSAPHSVDARVGS